ncbi:MAG TPA: efflux RND transporter periplasmic adaptor subunit [Candidatus Acidoferrales bacterium]|nr:efflux RND transporter periplasmic adaptor subunit [Candidatus Acidoferrales bacterium]
MKIDSLEKQASRAGIILLPLLLALAGCGQESPPTAEIPAPKVAGDQVQFASASPQLDSISVDEARARTIAVRHLTGRLYWDDDVTVRVFTPVAGRVTRVLAELGRAVTNGAPLLEIDSPDFGQALSAARTAVANLVAMDKANVRTRELFAHGAAAQKDVEAAEAAYVAALAERDRAEAVLANYGGSDKSTNEIYLLRSPLGGVVVDKSVNPGQELRADMMLGNVPQTFNSLFTVSDPTRLWLQLDVPEMELPVLAVGQRLTIHCEAFPGQVFEGSVDNIGDTLDPATRTVKVRGLVANPDGLLKAEMYVTVDVVEPTDRMADAGVEIPSSSVFMLDDQYYLFVETAPGQFKRQQVKVGSEADGKIPVLAGVNAGQKVVTEGALLLQSIINPAD